MLAEDNEEVRDMVSRRLKRAGFDVASFGDGAECLAAVTEDGCNPALLLTDVLMPVMGGRELAREVRKLLPELPIVLMSGQVDELTAGDGLAGKNVGFLAKPFTLRELDSILRKMLAASGA